MGRYRVIVLGFVLTATGAATALGGCGNSVVAIVNGKKITQKRFYEELETRYGEQTLVGLINQIVVEEAAAQAGVMPTEAEVDQAVTEVRRSAPSEEEFNMLLQSQGMTADTFREAIKREMLMRKLLTKDIRVTPDEVRRHYEKHKTEYGKPARVNYSQIVCDSMDKAKAAKSAVQGGADFAAVARQKSADELTKQQGGIVGWRTYEQIAPVELQNPISNLKEGEIAGPYHANNLFYVVMINAKAKAEVPDFNSPAVQMIVEQSLKVQKAVQQGLNVNDVVADLMRKANVNVLWQDYKRIMSLYQPMPGGALGPGEPVPGGGPGAVPPPVPGNTPAQPPAPVGDTGAPPAGTPPATPGR